MMRFQSDPFAALAIASVAALSLVGQAAAAGDFDGDGKDDLLLRHLHSDAWRYYSLVDDMPAEHELDLETEAVWRFVTSGDFDGNGYDDVLLRRYDTLESAYHALSADGVEARPVRLTVNPLYDILGAGDFDGDGADEVLIRRNESFGAWLYYDIDGARVTLRRNFGATQNLDFEFAAIGDLDGDGRDDILARHRTRGHWIAYLMNGTGRAALRRPRITQNLLFRLQGFADITGDDKADPLLRNTTTGEWIYYATGNRVGSGHAIAMRLHRGLGMPRDGAWAVASIGDYDGDGRATPLLRDPLTGQWRLFDIDGTTSDEVHFPGLEAELAWASVDTLPQGNLAELGRVEFLQGPPTYRKDYRTGEVIGPIAGNRPENGAPPRPPQELTIENRWSEADQGFVTALWDRWVAVAVAVDHPYSHPLPTLSARVVSAKGEAQDIPSVYDVTKTGEAAGYRTEMVFDVARELNAPGAVVEITVGGGGSELVESIPLFGETIEETIMRWVPIETATVPAVDNLGDEGYTDVLDAYMPIAEYTATVTEPVAYELTGDEQEGAEIDDRAVWDQLKMLQTTEGCGRGDLYIGVYNITGLRNAGVAPTPLAMWGGRGVMVLASGEDHAVNSYWGYLPGYAHEFAHAHGLYAHFSCPPYPVTQAEGLRYAYPYEDGQLGPARGWHRLAGDFMRRGVVVQMGPPPRNMDEPRDIMTACQVNFVSDFTYQMVLSFMQAPFNKAWVDEARSCLAETTAAGGHRTLAVLGEVSDDGSVTLLDMAVSDRPPWAVPTAATTPPGMRMWTLEMHDAGGGIVHRQPIPVPDPSRGLAGVERAWSYRVPYPPEAETVVVRAPSGDLRGDFAIACPRCGNMEAH